MRPLRELRPAPRTDDSSSSDPSGGLPPLEPSRLKRPPLTRIACDACRRRKTKCDGRRPACSACEASNRQCEYAGEPDISRTEALKRRIDEYQTQLSLSVELLDSLSSLPQPELVGILPRIRNADLATDLDKLVRIIQSGAGLVQLSQARGVDDSSGAATSSGSSLSLNPPGTTMPARVSAALQTITDQMSDLNASSRIAFLQSLVDELGRWIETEEFEGASSAP